MAPRPPLTARNAEIRTASVTVRSLTIEGKQVTLAVFRQLLEEHIYDWNTGQLRGVGWGHVNYLLDGADPDVIHLVWQLGDELRRCRLRPYHPWPPDMPTRSTYFVNHEQTILGCQGITWEPMPGHPKEYVTEIEDLDVKQVRQAIGPQPERPTIPEPYWENSKKPQFMKQLAEYDKQHAAWRQMEQQAIDAYKQRCAAALLQIVAEINAERARYAATVAPLFALPQLFIAV